MAFWALPLLLVLLVRWWACRHWEVSFSVLIFSFVCFRTVVVVADPQLLGAGIRRHCVARLARPRDFPRVPMRCIWTINKFYRYCLNLISQTRPSRLSPGPWLLVSMFFLGELKSALKDSFFSWVFNSVCFSNKFFLLPQLIAGIRRHRRARVGFLNFWGENPRCWWGPACCGTSGWWWSWSGAGGARWQRSRWPAPWHAGGISPGYPHYLHLEPVELPSHPSCG